MSDTPKTDDQVEHVDNIHNEWICRGRNSKAQELFVPADFARQLERELNDAIKERDRFKFMLQQATAALIKNTK